MKHHLILSSILLLTQCFGQDDTPLFQVLGANQTGIVFSNDIVESSSVNYFTQDNIYNGSGVAAGDLNNDGLADLYFVSNQGQDQIYLNLGDLKFQNITDSALPNQEIRGWKSGVLMADFNNDGWLDIYVTRYGLASTPMNERTNLLYINQGDMTFKEEGLNYGVGDGGRSIHAAVLDFDQDGDLDLFVVNHWKNSSVMEQFKNDLTQEKPYSNRLLRNDNGKFKDITSFENGTETHGYCLGAAVSDVNGDGWPDIYITNDYNLPDFLLINRRDGTFENQIRSRIRHTSHYSMGIDIADYNNDGLSDICVLDMSNKDYKKSKTNMGGMSIDHFWHNVAKGYPHQYMYNTFFLNLGAGYYSEIAQMAGISSTDWSWAPLLADLDRDGFKDLFVTNGYYRDVRDRDFVATLHDYVDSKPAHFDVEKMTALIPMSRDVNYLFKNGGDLIFEDKSIDWGIREGSISHGAAYSDLDNDGDLDLIVNNLNEPAMILRNNSGAGNFINIKLKGPEKNPFAVGTKVVIRIGDQQIVQELFPGRGYASSCDYQLNFGIGEAEKIDVLEVFWNHKEVTRFYDLKAGQTLVVDYIKNQKEPSGIFSQTYTVEDIFCPVKADSYDDFKRELLIPNKMSELGPFMSKGDINNDKKEDLFIGGGKNAKAELYQQDNKNFLRNAIPDIWADSLYEDGGSVFFDADGDGDQDLYVVSAGNEFEAYDTMYQDRLYLNDGQGGFTKAKDRLPVINSSGQCVKAFDIDHDGDQDLIVGGRQVPGMYPKNPETIILINKKGKFENKTDEIAPGLKEIGMVTDLEFSDVNGDGKEDLIILGEWMNIQVWIWTKKKYIQKELGIRTISEDIGINGWWNAIEPIDINNDGTMEFLVGNLGLNNKFHAGRHHPLKIYLDDFDGNGKYDIVLSKTVNGKEVPVRGKQCLSEQMPVISETFATYTDFANASFTDIFEAPEEFHFADNFYSGILVLENGVFTFKPFPNMAQIGPINDFIPLNLNGDEYMDFVAFGNKYEAEIETPRYDGNPGLVFINEGGSGEFRVYPAEFNGSFANKNAKDAILVGEYLLVANSMQSVNRVGIEWFGE